MSGPNIDFWQSRFVEQSTPWDRGHSSPQLHAWGAQGNWRALGEGARVAVPGCGSGHEVTALAQCGLAVTAIDCAPAAIDLAQERWRSTQEIAPVLGQASPQPEQQGNAEAEKRAECTGSTIAPTFVLADVLTWEPDTPFDAVYEQTCLCALHPDHWTHYATALHRWLKPGGRLFALFMQSRQTAADTGFVQGPPYHVDIHAARALFPEPLWAWPKPPFEVVPHPRGLCELAVVLHRR